MNKEKIAGYSLGILFIITICITGSMLSTHYHKILFGTTNMYYTAEECPECAFPKLSGYTAMFLAIATIVIIPSIVIQCVINIYLKKIDDL